ncbi:MAG TPA: Uma2 family endonuclease [Spirochaetia bacterium]|nr:MAG: hypothetical protein A2Y41_03200 [Spirochaetes bacterium GWB1_36_13]HCL57856.1 Uma2 family endonuclease [Spirochaetia bacterium]
MSLAVKDDQIYTYADYLSWNEEKRLELIEGTVYDMSPAPSRIHQTILGELFFQMKGVLKNKACSIFPAPFDVRLGKRNTQRDEEIETVVQPDISIVCDSSKLDDRGCAGAPDLIVEITSPSTAIKDMREKYRIYEKYGVREYWVVYPSEKIIMVFLLENGSYGKANVFSSEETLNSSAVQDLKIDLAKIFI